MRKKVYIDALVLDGEYQGSVTYVVQLIHFLVNQRDLEVYVGLHDLKSVDRHSLRLNRENIILIRRTNRAVKYLITLPLMLFNLKPDLAIFQYYSPLFHHNRTRIILIIHDMLMHDMPEFFAESKLSLKLSLLRISVKKASYIFTVSNYSKQRIISILSFNENNVFLTLNGLSDFWRDLPNFDVSKSFVEQTYGVKDYILIVNRIEKRKNFEIIFDLAELYFKDIFVIVGSNTYVDLAFESRCSEFPNILRIHSVSSENLKHLYRAAKLFLYPSFAEGFGIPPLEALSQLCSVVCAKNTALQELKGIEEGFFNAYDLNTLLLARDNVMKRDEFKKLMIREIVLNHYNWTNSFGVIPWRKL